MLVRTESPGRTPRLSHGTWTMLLRLTEATYVLCVLKSSALCIFRVLYLWSFLCFAFLIGRRFYARRSCHNLRAWPACVLSSPVSQPKQVVLSCCLATRVFEFRAEPVSGYFPLACYSLVSYWRTWCMLHNVPSFWFKLTHGRFRHDRLVAVVASVYFQCMCVQISSLYAAKLPVLPLNMYAANPG